MAEPDQDLDHRAQAAATAIKAAGGLLGRGDLEHRWTLSRSRVRRLTLAEDFPPAIATINGQPVWLGDVVDHWRANRRGPGRPRTRPDT